MATYRTLATTPGLITKFRLFRGVLDDVGTGGGDLWFLECLALVGDA